VGTHVGLLIAAIINIIETAAVAVNMATTNVPHKQVATKFYKPNAVETALFEEPNDPHVKQMLDLIYYRVCRLSS
jgi:hypothetical protein